MTSTIGKSLAYGLLTGGLLSSGSALAHHSFAAYDAKQVRTLDGMVETFDWTNPHVALTVLVQPDVGGQPQEWSIETSSPVILTRFGWTRDSLKRGDRIRVICNPMGDGTHAGRLHTVVMLGSGQTLKTKLSGDAPPIPQ
jgi:hypothetical protein